jgi:hypothetical protein
MFKNFSSVFEGVPSLVCLVGTSEYFPYTGGIFPLPLDTQAAWRASAPVSLMASLSSLVGLKVHKIQEIFPWINSLDVVIRTLFPSIWKHYFVHSRIDFHGINLIEGAHCQWSE